jgi:tRNA dimethylallyltransferase
MKAPRPTKTRRALRPTPPKRKKGGGAVTYHRAVVLAGPTGSGKSAAALKFAREENGVIINADALQVYDALHTLTAHPTEEEMAQAPHRLYSWLGPDESCSAVRWRAAAIAEMQAAADAGKLPILTGGTGLYIKSLIEGFSPIPDVPAATRDAANELQARLGNPAFHAALEKRDPAMAARLHPNDTQRLIRAYEVFEATGRSLAEWQEEPPVTDPASDMFRYEVRIVTMPSEEIRARCDARFDRMLEMGALDEVRALDMEIGAGRVAERAPVTNALGFTPLRAALHGELGMEQAVRLGKAETRQYVKRQDTWFRNQVQPHPRITSIEML